MHAVLIVIPISFCMKKYYNKLYVNLNTEIITEITRKRYRWMDIQKGENELPQTS